MGFQRHIFGAAITTVIMIAGHSALAQTADAPIVIHGVATTADGKPLAHARLYTTSSAENDSLMLIRYPIVTIMTDDRGQFTWTPAQDLSVITKPDQKTPEFYYLPADAQQWRAEVKTSARGDIDYAQRSTVKNAARLCVTTWSAMGAEPLLHIVAPDSGTLETQLRGPDGKPLAHKSVQAVLLSGDENTNSSMVYSGQTDGGGRVRLRAFPGFTQLTIVAPGIGFGATGVFRIEANLTSTPSIPPLAPFAGVSGTADAALATPGAVVRTDDRDWYNPQTTIDSRGRFTLEDLLPGSRPIVVEGVRKPGESDGDFDDAIRRTRTETALAPGERRTGIFLVSRNPFPMPYYEEISGPIVALTGRVTDAAGAPIAGADVYAEMSYSISDYVKGDLRTATTDANGEYKINGVHADIFATRLTVTTVKAGYPITTAVVRRIFDAKAVAKPRRFVSSPPVSGYQADCVLPLERTELIVHVLQRGKPLANAVVALTAPGAWTPGYQPYPLPLAVVPPQVVSFGFPSVKREPDPPVDPKPTTSDKLRRLLDPRTTTDANGDAHFVNVRPGLWSVTAWDSALLKTPTTRPYDDLKHESVTVTGVSIAAGEPHRFTLSVQPPPPADLGQSRVQVLRPDGKPAANTAVDLETEIPHTDSFEMVSSSGGTTDTNGFVPLYEADQGRKKITVRLHAFPEEPGFPATRPFNEGSAVVTFSRSQPVSIPAAVIATKLHQLGSLRVHLEDAPAGATGAVVTQDYTGSRRAAALDTRLEAVFTGLSSYEQMVSVSLTSARRPPFVGVEGEPFPQDSTLIGLSSILPKRVQALADRETRVTFRTQPVGYIRGLIQVSDAPQNYYVSFDRFRDTPADVHYERATGEFLIGPLPVGKVALGVGVVLQTEEDHYAADDASVTVTVSSNHVANVVLTPARSSAKSMLNGQVFQDDGVTPTWGARACVIVPGSSIASMLTIADGQGNLFESKDNFSPSPFWMPQPPSKSDPKTPVAIAWLPGSLGAAVIPYIPGKTLRFVLPKSISQHGRVTVAGQAIDGLSSEFTITAAYQGRGSLNRVLSVNTTAQSDGSFDLRGLTPGTYEIHATRDGVLDTKTQTVRVGADVPLPDLTFDFDANDH